MVHTKVRHPLPIQCGAKVLWKKRFAEHSDTWPRGARDEGGGIDGQFVATSSDDVIRGRRHSACRVDCFKVNGLDGSKRPFLLRRFVKQISSISVGRHAI